MRTRLPLSYGNAIARCFYLEDAPSVLIRPLSRQQLAVTRVTVENGLPDPTASVCPESAFTIAVHLRDPDFSDWGTWVAGKFHRVKSWVAGGIAIYDLETDPIAFRPTAFDVVHYNLPRTTLDAFTEDSGLPRVDSLLCEQGTKDPVIYYMTQTLLPCLESNTQLSDLFFDHFVQMLCGRLVESYGSVKPFPERHCGGLAPWQMSRARELLDQHLAGDLKLASLAKECGLSVSQFARSFKRSFGASVHRYLVSQRVEEAKWLLLYSDKELSEIGLQLGFCDQSAFSRTFSAAVGTPPGKWRAVRRSKKFADARGGMADQAESRSH
jgi:AraC family transcriptional regulator